MDVSNLTPTQLTTFNAKKQELVRRGEEIGRKARGFTGWSHQVRRLLGVASGETEPLVMLNLLRYQSVRNKDSWGKERAELAEPLEADMQWCCAEANGNEALAMVLIQHLLCYAYRQYTFETKQAEPAEPN